MRLFFCCNISMKVCFRSQVSAWTRSFMFMLANFIRLMQMLWSANAGVLKKKVHQIEFWNWPANIKWTFEQRLAAVLNRDPISSWCKFQLIAFPFHFMQDVQATLRYYLHVCLIPGDKSLIFKSEAEPKTTRAAFNFRGVLCFRSARSPWYRMHSEIPKANFILACQEMCVLFLKPFTECLWFHISNTREGRKWHVNFRIMVWLWSCSGEDLCQKLGKCDQLGLQLIFPGLTMSAFICRHN